MTAWLVRSPTSSLIDDECSLSSTLSVGNNSPKQPLLTPSSKPIGRRVSFDESCNESYENTLYTQEDSASTWFTYEEYQMFRHNSSSTSRAIMRAETCGSTASPSFTSILEEAYGACYDDCGPSPLQLEKMQKLCAITEGERVGLERRAVRFIAKDKTRCRAALVRAMFSLKFAQSQQPHHAEWVEEELRWQCENISRACRMFAQHVAQAQWAVEL